jgi:hypothetical protein
MKNVVLFFVGLMVKLGVLTPKRVAILKFVYKCHKWPNFKQPRDINEKINWMKFYGDTSLWPMLADKYTVREYVAERVGSDVLIPLIGKWDSVDDIDWAALPMQFAMKCNNGSGDVIICKDKSKLDIKAVKKHFASRLHEKFSILSGEPHYASIKPCIIAEQLLDSTTQPCGSSSLIDYKIWVFDGIPMYTWCTWNREKYHADVALFDMDWQFHPEWSVWTSHYRKPKKLVPKPKCFEKMMKIAGDLGKGLPVARIDLYCVDEAIYFGEITMTSQGGYMDFYTREFLDKMGNLTVLPAA